MKTTLITALLLGALFSTAHAQRLAEQCERWAGTLGSINSIHCVETEGK